MDFSLTGPQQHYRETLRRFGEVLAGGTFRERWKALAAQGLTGLPVPAEHGGTGFGATDTALALEALAEGCTDGGLCFSLAAHLYAGLLPLLEAGSAEQKKILPAIVAGDVILANAMTEAVSGSDAFALRTTATKQNDHYRISGSKVFVTNAPEADKLIVYALTDPGKGFFGGISAFLLDRQRHAYRVGPAMDKLGLDTSPLAEVFFEDTVVHETDLLGKPGSGALLFQHSMNHERSGIAALHCGTMQRLLHRSAAYAKQRTLAGHPVAQHQAVAFRLADMQVRLSAARLLAFRACAAVENNERHAARLAAQAKIYASEALAQCAQDALLIHGGNGFIKAYGIESALRDAQAALIYSGTNDVLRDLVAKLL